MNHIHDHLPENSRATYWLGNYDPTTKQWVALKGLVYFCSEPPGAFSFKYVSGEFECPLLDKVDELVERALKQRCKTVVVVSDSRGRKGMFGF